MGIIHTHMVGILKPYAENVYELHQTVVDLASSMNALEEKAGVLEQLSIRMNGMQGEQNKLMQFAQSNRQSLDSFIEESGKIDKARAKSIQNVEDTLTLVKNDIEQLQKNGQELNTKLVMYQYTEKEHRSQLKSELQVMADNVRRADEAQAAMIKHVDSHMLGLDAAITQNKEHVAQQQSYLHEKFTTLNNESMDKLKLLNEQFAESESQLKQYRKEFEEARDATTQSLLSIKDDLGKTGSSWKDELGRIDTDLRSQIRAIDTKAEDLNSNVNKLITQGQQQQEDMKDVRGNLGNLEAIANKVKGELTALQTATGDLPGRVAQLEEDATFTAKHKIPRLEKALGLEPMTKENADPKRDLKKRASSAMLTEDQLTRKAWAAWTEAIREAKQEKTQNAIPNIQAMLKKHSELMESEKSKLHTTSNRVQTLEVDLKGFSEEMQKLRKSLDVNDGHWKGMTKGLQEAKKTMHSELKQLPPLAGIASPKTSRPASSMM